MRKAFCLLVLVFAVIGLSGCPKDSALIMAKDAAQGNLSFERSVTAAHKDGFCDDACEKPLLQVSVKIAQGDDMIVSLITKNDKQGAFTQIDNVIATIDDAVANGILGIKNDGRQAEARTFLVGVRGVLTTAKALLGK